MGKITLDMSEFDVFLTMSEGNVGAASIIMKLLNTPDGILYLCACDELDIRGSKLYMLYNDCCGNNYEKFKRTFALFNENAFTSQEIHDNLGMVRAIPFVDDEIKIEGIPEYGEPLDDCDEELWKTYKKAQQESFEKRFIEWTR